VQDVIAAGKRGEFTVGKDGRILIPDKPGLGVEPNPDHVRAHLAPGETWWS